MCLAYRWKTSDVVGFMLEELVDLVLPFAGQRGAKSSKPESRSSASVTYNPQYLLLFLYLVLFSHGRIQMTPLCSRSACQAKSILNLHLTQKVRFLY